MPRNAIQIREDTPTEIHIYPYINLSDPNNTIGADFAIFTGTFLFPPGPNLELRLDGHYSFNFKGTPTLKFYPFWKDEIEHYIQVAKTQGYSFFDRLHIRRQLPKLVMQSIPVEAIPYVLNPFILKRIRAANQQDQLTEILEAIYKLDSIEGYQKAKDWNYIAYDGEQVNAMAQKNLEEISELLSNPPLPRKNKNNIIQFKKR